MLCFKYSKTPCLSHKKGADMAKRSNGEGTLRQRADGRWEMTIMEGFRDDGKRKTKSFYGKTQKEVKAKAKAYFEAKAAGLVTDNNYSFADWADLWFDHHKDNISPTTQESYRYTLRILKEGFARRRIAGIKPYDIEMFLRKLRQEGRSDSGIAQCRGMLYQIFNKAEANDLLIRRNPVRFAEKMRRKGPVQRKESFTAEEVRILLDQLPDNKIGWSIRLMLGTGARTQEILALESRHIEPNGARIHIRQAIKMVKGTAVIGPPKSQDSLRDIPVPENIRYCAINLRATDKTYIWESEKKGGSPCNPSTFRNHFKKALEAIPGVRVLTPHSCRHTYVSQMQALGVDLATIQSIVGHANLDMTQKYLHVQESIRQDAIARFSKAFSSNDQGPDKPTDGACNVIQFPSVG